jgi:hypothetical protein
MRDTFLRNNREISDYLTSVARQRFSSDRPNRREPNSWIATMNYNLRKRETAISTLSVPRYYRQDQSAQ